MAKRFFKILTKRRDLSPFYLSLTFVCLVHINSDHKCVYGEINFTLEILKFVSDFVKLQLELVFECLLLDQR